MHDCPLKWYILTFWRKLHRMMNMHSKYDSMHKNEMFYILIWINDHALTSISCMLSRGQLKD